MMRHTRLIHLCFPLNHSQKEEQKLLDDEKALEEDAAKFDAFLKENDKNSVEAIKKYAGRTPLFSTSR